MLLIEESRSTPLVHFNPDQSVYEIVGKCFPENTDKFVDPVLAWVDKWEISNPVSIRIELFYISSAATITIVKLLKRIANKEGGNNVSVVWNYEADDDEARKTGESIKSLVPNIKFDLVELVE